MKFSGTVHRLFTWIMLKGNDSLARLCKQTYCCIIGYSYAMQIWQNKFDMGGLVEGLSYTSAGVDFTALKLKLNLNKLIVGAPYSLSTSFYAAIRIDATLRSCHSLLILYSI